jgi:hypothetical protein
MSAGTAPFLYGPYDFPCTYHTTESECTSEAKESTKLMSRNGYTYTDELSASSPIFYRIPVTTNNVLNKTLCLTKIAKQPFSTEDKVSVEVGNITTEDKVSVGVRNITTTAKDTATKQTTTQTRAKTAWTICFQRQSKTARAICFQGQGKTHCHRKGTSLDQNRFEASHG